MMHPRARNQRLEMLIGILGFFNLMALITAVVAFVRGQSMLQPMVVLIGCTGLLWFAVRVRTRA
jgi:Flp pilus assembly protein TadB